jgi:cell division protein FtsL
MPAKLDDAAIKGNHAMWNVFWSTNLRRTATSIFALITALASSIVAVPPAVAIVSDWQPVAFKTFVLETIQSKTDPMLQTESKLLIAQAQTTATLNQIYLSQLQASLYAAQQDQQKAPSHTVDQRIEELQQQIKDLQRNTGGSR